ncbi:MAG: hypothetical protein AMXMBFR84_17780 [Candidatus Hydrogenedentota bacterium]
MKRLAAVLLVPVLAFVFTACEKKEPEKPEAPPPPPPPSAEQLSQQVITQVTPMLALGSAGSPQMVGMLTGEFGKLRGEVNGEKAMMQVRNWLKEQLRASMDAQAWDVALGLCDAVDAVEPGNSRTTRSRERALSERNKPQVTVKGFYEEKTNGTVTIFMDVYLPATGTMESVRVREGEEVLGLKIEKIIGDNKGVRIKYLETGQSYDVAGP